VNQVELLGTYGGDETHALSAWTSTARELTEAKKARIGNLLGMLASEGHTSPFEKSYLHFLVTADTASHIHIIKHRIGVSVNGESARYKEFKQDKYHIPDDWPKYAKELLEEHSKKSFEYYHTILTALVDDGYDRKRAKESARFFLPYSTQVTLDVGFNFLSFIKFQKLRNDEHAQAEIRGIADEMLSLVRDTHEFDLSLAAWGY